uniref:Uncharacterized protein n=1 Tax=Leptocylindrus danicus TaxID=163516 RepID=A0A7S2KEE2_9STRA|mmetsp:Transcript_21466/g.32043  ORF Transcript_21466/g.32043 Transcript_21466/m.32043 type:complete len:254 (+) Transcript_21466:135-896(+)
MPPLAVTKPIKVPSRIAMENKAIYFKEETSRSSSQEVHAAAKTTIDTQATRRAHGRQSLVTHHNNRNDEHSSNQSCDESHHHPISKMRMREYLANVDAFLQEAGSDSSLDGSSVTKDEKSEIEHGSSTVETLEEEENAPVLKNNTPNIEQESSSTDQMDRLKYRRMLKSVLERNELSLDTTINTDKSRHEEDMSKARKHMTHVHSFLQENYNLFCSYSTMPGIKVRFQEFNWTFYMLSENTDWSALGGIWPLM